MTMLPMRRFAEKEVGRQYQRVDRNGLCQLKAQLGQLITGQDGKGLLRIHLWCPDDLPRLWERIDIAFRIKRNILKNKKEQEGYVITAKVNFHWITIIAFSAI